MTATVPVALFAYTRPDLLTRTLQSLKENDIPLIYAFSDGARQATDEPLVQQVRTILRAVTWARVVLVEREKNLGLGTNIVSGTTEVLTNHDAVIVCEDDLVAVPGTVAWLSAALDHYRDDDRVMSVSGWTHPRVTPPGIGSAPFFSPRVNTLFWGTWARAWRGMDTGSASGRLSAYATAGGDPAAYGADLPLQAAAERERNIWAVRFIADHMARQGLSLCPPWSMVEHIGYDARATNAVHDPTWYQPAPGRAAPIPAVWPEPAEHPAIAGLWRAAVEVELAAGAPPSFFARVRRRLRRMFGARD